MKFSDSHEIQFLLLDILMLLLRIPPHQMEEEVMSKWPTRQLLSSLQQVFETAAMEGNREGDFDQLTTQLLTVLACVQAASHQADLSSEGKENSF